MTCYYLKSEAAYIRLKEKANAFIFSLDGTFRLEKNYRLPIDAKEVRHSIFCERFQIWKQHFRHFDEIISL